MKTIKIFSIGNRWDINIAKPDDNTIQHVIDVRDLPDPWGSGGFQYENQDGTDPSVQSWMEKNGKEQINTFIEISMAIVTNFLNKPNNFNHLEIVFRCKAGFQRSVCLAEKLLTEIKSSQNVKVSVHHSTMELARKTFQPEFIKKQG